MLAVLAMQSSSFTAQVGGSSKMETGPADFEAAWKFIEPDQRENNVLVGKLDNLLELLGELGIDCFDDFDGLDKEHL